MSKAEEFRGKSSDDLLEKLLELRRKQFGLRMQRGTGQVIRSSEMRETKKAIARLKTILRENDQGINSNG
ncbi:MAG: 50S ribosomal protein L29 [Pseudomonadota bacterium]|nr:50S ribosomal protein L29 [Pseudomonadota bacterium]